jgi:pimeloyl-ACP methyl ester carboxylesterase
VTSQFFDIVLPSGSASIAHTWRGDPSARGPTIVLLHHGLGAVAQWHELPQRLHDRTGLTVFAYDRPGYGLSSLRDEGGAVVPHRLATDFMHTEALEVLPAVLAAAGIEQPILVGHSDGGSIALIAASAGFDLGILAVASVAAHSYVEPVCLVGIRAAGAGREAITRGMARYHQDAAATFDAWHTVWLTPEFASWSIEEQLANVTCPVLAVQGSDDEFATEDMLFSIADAVADARGVELLPDCGHMVHRDQPDVIAELLVSFVGELN